MKTSKQKRFAAIFAGMLCISCLTAPFSATAETADTAGENDTLAAAEELPLNTAVSGEISAKGDVDYYKITLPEDGTLQMGMTADWVSGFGESYRVAFYTADGTTVFQDDYVAENIQFPADGWKAGVYYFSVKPEYDTYPPKSAYTLTANFTPKSQWATDSSYELEPNGNFNTANPIALATPCKGVFSDSNDADCYTFSTEEAGKISVILENPDQSTANCTVILYNEAQEPVGKAALRNNSTSVTIPEQGFNAGTFYVQVKTDNTLTNNWKYAEQYQLTVDFTPTGDTYESEPNDTTANADTLPVNAPVTGKLVSVNDTDFYKVTLNSAAQFSLTLEHALPDNLSKSGNAWTVTCYQYDEKAGSLRETPVLTMQTALEQTKTTSDTALVRGGTFYVKVENKSYSAFSDQEYTLTMQTELLTYEKGDVNADGSVDTQDLFEMLYSCAKSSAGIREDLLEGAAFLAADIDENDALDSTDIYYALLYIAQKSAGLPTSWESVVQ